MKSALKLTTFFIIFLLSLSACTSMSKTPTLNPTEGVQLLAGEYTTTIASDDLKKIESLDPDLPTNVGNWRLSLTSDGKFTVSHDGAFAADGNYEVKGDRLSVYVGGVCDNCSCEGAIGRFIYKLQDNQLTLGKTAGTCAAMDLLTVHPLTRQP
jgi:hypothetical protein